MFQIVLPSHHWNASGPLRLSSCPSAVKVSFALAASFLWTIADVPHVASNLSTSDRNSLFSILSFQSNTSSSSQSSIGAATHYNDKSAATLDRRASPPPPEQELSFPTTAPALSEHVCKACNGSFKDKGSLVRHEKEQCECPGKWHCTVCSTGQIFVRKERLTAHHMEAHSHGCLNGCNKAGRLLCHECARHISMSYRDLPRKVAWGCPCCLSCFVTSNGWREHSHTHGIRDKKVIGWSLTLMIQSLLRHPNLAVARSRYLWEQCEWQTVPKDILQEIRRALERHNIPENIQVHPTYHSISNTEAVVLYCYRLAKYGQAFSDPETAAVAELASNEYTWPQGPHGDTPLYRNQLGQWYTGFSRSSKQRRPNQRTPGSQQPYAEAEPRSSHTTTANTAVAHIPTPELPEWDPSLDSFLEQYYPEPSFSPHTSFDVDQTTTSGHDPSRLVATDGRQQKLAHRPSPSRGDFSQTTDASPHQTSRPMSGVLNTYTGLY